MFILILIIMIGIELNMMHGWFLALTIISAITKIIKLILLGVKAGSEL